MEKFIRLDPAVNEMLVSMIKRLRKKGHNISKKALVNLILTNKTLDYLQEIYNV